MRVSMYRDMATLDSVLKSNQFTQNVGTHDQLKSEMVSWFCFLGEHILLPALECMNYITGYVTISMTEVRVCSILYHMGAALQEMVATLRNKSENHDLNGDVCKSSTQRTQMVEEIWQITGNILVDNPDWKMEIFETGIIETIFDWVVVSLRIHFSRSWKSQRIC